MGPLPYELQFLLALLLTLFIEISVALLLRLLVTRSGATRAPFLFLKPLALVSPGRLIFAGLAASCLTLPYLWFVLPAFLVNRSLFLLLGELGVTGVEALFYRQMLPLKFSGALLLSILCNAASFLLGLLLQHAF